MAHTIISIFKPRTVLNFSAQGLRFQGKLDSIIPIGVYIWQISGYSINYARWDDISDIFLHFQHLSIP